MFEKEAEEWVKENMDCCRSENCTGKDIPYFDEEERCCAKSAFQDGAEFGYNKAFVEADKNLKAVVADFNKANEWHYMKDVNCYEDLHFPPEEEEKGRVLIWKVQVVTEKGIKEPVCYHCGSYGDLWYEINAYHVIAWKEIVLPEFPKESE